MSLLPTPLRCSIDPRAVRHRTGRRACALRGPIQVSVLTLTATALTHVSPAQAQPLARVDVAAWTARAVSLGREAGRRDASNETRDAIVLAMCRHARVLDPTLPLRCANDDVDGAGFIVVYVLGPEERLVTISLDGGAVLANTTVVPYHVRLGVTPVIRRLSVPSFYGGRRTTESNTSGLVDVNGRTLTVINRCCAGTEGTTSSWRIVPRGALTLARVVRWRVDDGRERSTVLFPPQ